MIILMDTDTCSYLIAGVPSVVQKYREHVQAQDLIGISAITAFELKQGLAMSTKSSQLERFVHELVTALKVFNFGVEAAGLAGQIRASQIKAGKSTGFYDPLLAAHAISLNALLVTNNTKHFSGIPKLLLANWMN